MNKKYYVISILFILLFCIGSFFVSQMNDPALRLRVQMISGCGNEAQKTFVVLDISKNHERYEILDQDGLTREIIFSDFKKRQSWTLYPQKKQALLMSGSSQVPSPPLQNLKLIAKKETTCLDGRICSVFTLTTSDDETIEVQVLLSSFVGVDLWKFSQQRDSATWGALKTFIDTYAPSKPIVSLQTTSKLGCRRITVNEFQSVSLSEKIYQIPRDYTKKSYTELQKLPAEVRESILKKQ